MVRLRMHRRMVLSVFPLFLLVLCVATSGGEREALLELKALVSDPAGVLSDWGATAGHCSWRGVSCDARRRVVAVNISSDTGGQPAACTRSFPFVRRCHDEGRGLAGKLSPSIGKLSDLRILSLPCQSFYGEIPVEVWGIEKLEVLDLEGNSLVGTLPSRFPRQLRILNLASNLITGEIPCSLSRCVHLEVLDLSRNRLYGSLPSFLGSFPKLNKLLLSSNHLENSIPDDIWDACSSLEHLDLSGNSLVGSIPRSLGNCSNLRSLLLFSNLLHGVIPTDLGHLKMLRALDVSRNNLSGPIPEELGNCKELALLVLVNLFDPMLSSTFLTYEKNHELNYFHGGISEKITSLPKLRILWAPRGNLVGELPSYWGGCKNLEMVNLGQNHFTGRIPRDLDKCANIRFLDFSMNKLTGWVSEELSVPCMDLFDVSGNQLSGSIPSFIRKQCPLLPIPEDDLLLAYTLFFTYWALVDFGILSSESIGNHSVYHNFACNNFSATFSSPVVTGRYGKHTVNALKLDRNPFSVSLSGRVFGKCRKFSGVVADSSDNLISAEIPAVNIVKCCPLMVLNLSGNQITGVIPPSIGLLENLVVLDLGGNRLNGQIPVGLSCLKRLKYFSLGNNNFSGRIPDELEQLHSLRKLDLSSNYLSGITGGLLKFRRLSVIMLRDKMVFGKAPSHSANITSVSIFKISHLQNSSADSSSHDDNNRSQISSNKTGDGFSSIEIAGIASGAALVSVLALLILYMYARKCTASSSVESSEIQDVTIFVDIGVPLSYDSVVRATGNFNASNCIGSGGFGATYKAEVSPGVLVAIKRLSVGRLQGVQQFHAEIKTIGRWRHSNLVTLIGYYGSDTEMFLIYNYLPGGNLERFIQERSRRAVDWKMIHKIALDVARALAYLHDQCTPRILHRDVKPSNILLDNDCNAYLSDFGLARLLGNSETHATTGVAGTFGYVAPEYAMTCRVSDKADVYSYGVVLMELLSDKKALDPSFSPYGDGFNIVAWASMLLQQGRVHEFFTEGLWFDSSHQHLLETLKLAIRCTEEQLSQRPRMKQVVRVLKELEPPAC